MTAGKKFRLRQFTTFAQNQSGYCQIRSKLDMQRQMTPVQFSQGPVPAQEIAKMKFICN